MQVGIVAPAPFAPLVGVMAASSVATNGSAWQLSTSTSAMPRLTEWPFVVVAQAMYCTKGTSVPPGGEKGMKFQWFQGHVNFI